MEVCNKFRFVFALSLFFSCSPSNKLVHRLLFSFHIVSLSVVLWTLLQYVTKKNNFFVCFFLVVVHFHQSCSYELPALLVTLTSTTTTTTTTTTTNRKKSEPQFDNYKRVTDFIPLFLGRRSANLRGEAGAGRGVFWCGPQHQLRESRHSRAWLSRGVEGHPGLRGREQTTRAHCRC